MSFLVSFNVCSGPHVPERAVRVSFGPFVQVGAVLRVDVQSSQVPQVSGARAAPVFGCDRGFLVVEDGDFDGVFPGDAGPAPGTPAGRPVGIDAFMLDSCFAGKDVHLSCPPSVPACGFRASR